MKLTRLKIHNFRAIEDQELSFQAYTLLVGPNNAGKSTILDALRVFYEDDLKFQPERDTPRIPVSDTESWLDLDFELAADEHASLADAYRAPSPVLRVRKYLRTDLKLADGKTRNGVISGFKPDGTLSGEAFYGAKGTQTGKFGKVIYIPALSSVDDQAKLSGPSGLRDIVTSIISDVVGSSPAFVDFEKAVAAFGASLRAETTKDGRSLAGVEAEVDKLLKSWNTTFRINVTPPSPADFIKSMLTWDLRDVGLTRFRGHLRKGGYDAEYGQANRCEAIAPAVS